MMAAAILAAVLYAQGPVAIEGDGKVDMARSLFLRVTPKDIDLRNRFRGFRVAEDYDDDTSTRWRLIPEPGASAYKIAPFAFAGKVHGPVYFENPAPLVAEGGAMTAAPRRDLPPLTPRLAFALLAALLAAAGLVVGCWSAIRYLARRVREHYLSPIERAWAELARLLQAQLPAKGRFKDFYVELTLVVRRYIQRKYGIKAPHLTTQEFLKAAEGVCDRAATELKDFLESADMVKFAGVAATGDMADAAVKSARKYLEGDSGVR